MENDYTWVILTLLAACKTLAVSVWRLKCFVRHW